MISSAYVRTMASYNTAMNQRLYAAAGRLSDAERRLDRGAFWGSIHGTFSHLLWADAMWMSRFDGWQKPPVPLPQSAGPFDEFAAMAAARVEADARLEQWAARVDDDWLAQDQAWSCGAARRELRRPRTLLLAHVFNHQTHHRGQAHAMLTAAGENTGDTDLMALA